MKIEFDGLSIMTNIIFKNKLDKNRIKADSSRLVEETKVTRE